MLVVDDELAVARAVERWLQRRHIEVSVLCDPAAFAGELARVKPDAVISDYSMPVVDGVTLLQECLAVAPLVKRCLLSGALSQVTDAQRASIAPCLFLAKPFDDAALEGFLLLLGGAA